jgi:hypothetical protein
MAVFPTAKRFRSSRENRSSGSHRRPKKLWSGTLPELSGGLGKANTLASQKPLPQLWLRGLDLTSQAAPGTSFPLSAPIDGAWPDRFA